MGLETATFIPELVDTNPLGASDQVSQGDNHLRMIKGTLLNSFPGFVGTAATPKFVTKTEDQINDLGEKSVANVWTARQQFNAGTLVANNQQYLGFETNGTTQVSLAHVNPSDEVVFGDADNDTNILYNAICMLFQAGVQTGQFVSRALGSILVFDMLGNVRKAGFRNPGPRGLSASDDVKQEDEGQIVQLSGSGATLSLPALDADTTVTVKNIGVGPWTLAESSTGINWLSGGTVVAGPRTLAVGSVCQLQWRTGATIDIWGNGIS